MSGWIKLHRSVIESTLWTLEPFTKGQAWVDLLMLTNYKAKSIKIKNGELIEIQRGECGISELGFSQRWKWSRGKVKRFFDFLITEKMIQQKLIKNTTITLICNYELYQDETTNETTDGHNLRIKEVKKREFNKLNSQEGEKFSCHAQTEKQASKFIPPSPEQVQDYCNAHNYSINPYEFVNFYQSKGWYVGKNKMKDWQACLRTWESKRKNTPQTQGQSEEEQRKQVFQNVLERRKARGEE